MNFRALISTTVACCIAGTVLMAQTKKPAPKAGAKPPAKTENRPKPVYRQVPVFLGNSEFGGGKIPKQAFDSLLKEGLTAKDSAGNLVPVTEFWFVYKERNLYEDSAGRYYVGVDLLSDFCKGNKLTNVISANIYDRTKAGDTVLFNNVWVMMPDSTPVRGLPLDLIITK